MHTLVLVLMMLANTTVLAPRYIDFGPIAVDDDYEMLYPLAYVDIPVLDNDLSGKGGGPLRVTGVSAERGGKAAVVDGKFVRVAIEWSSIGEGAIAHGTYTIANDRGSSEGSWTVWYWSEIEP